MRLGTVVVALLLQAFKTPGYNLSPGDRQTLEALLNVLQGKQHQQSQTMVEKPSHSSSTATTLQQFLQQQQQRQQSVQPLQLQPQPQQQQFLVPSSQQNQGQNSMRNQLQLEQESQQLQQLLQLQHQQQQQQQQQSLALLRQLLQRDENPHPNTMTPAIDYNKQLGTKQQDADRVLYPYTGTFPQPPIFLPSTSTQLTPIYWCDTCSTGCCCGAQCCDTSVCFGATSGSQFPVTQAAALPGILPSAQPTTATGVSGSGLQGLPSGMFGLPSVPVLPVQQASPQSSTTFVPQSATTVVAANPPPLQLGTPMLACSTGCQCSWGCCSSFYCSPFSKSILTTWNSQDGAGAPTITTTTVTSTPPILPGMPPSPMLNSQLMTASPFGFVQSQQPLTASLLGSSAFGNAMLQDSPLTAVGAAPVNPYPRNNIPLTTALDNNVLNTLSSQMFPQQQLQQPLTIAGQQLMLSPMVGQQPLLFSSPGSVGTVQHFGPVGANGFASRGFISTSISAPGLVLPQTVGFNTVHTDKIRRNNVGHRKRLTRQNYQTLSLFNMTAELFRVVANLALDANAGNGNSSSERFRIRRGRRQALTMFPYSPLFLEYGLLSNALGIYGDISSACSSTRTSSSISISTANSCPCGCCGDRCCSQLICSTIQTSSAISGLALSAIDGINSFGCGLGCNCGCCGISCCNCDMTAYGTKLPSYGLSVYCSGCYSQCCCGSTTKVCCQCTSPTYPGFRGTAGPKFVLLGGRNAEKIARYGLTNDKT